MSKRPTYEELEKELQQEINIKNNMLFFITFRNELGAYQTYLSMGGSVNRIDVSKRMQMMLHADKLIAIADVTRSKNFKMQFDIHPN